MFGNIGKPESTGLLITGIGASVAAFVAYQYYTKHFCSSTDSGLWPLGYTYRWPRPSVTVDNIVVSQPSDREPAQVLLIRRKYPPYKDCWALPGGFVDKGEGLDTAAGRELQEETSVDPKSVSLTQVAAFGDPGRDPRGWNVTVAYAALVPNTDLGVKAADDAKDAGWFDVSSLPQQLAFDHKFLIRNGLLHLAKQPEAKAVAGLAASLEAAAAKLVAPWTIDG